MHRLAKVWAGPIGRRMSVKYTSRNVLAETDQLLCLKRLHHVSLKVCKKSPQGSYPREACRKSQFVEAEILLGSQGQECVKLEWLGLEDEVEVCIILDLVASTEDRRNLVDRNVE